MGCTKSEKKMHIINKMCIFLGKNRIEKDQELIMKKIDNELTKREKRKYDKKFKNSAAFRLLFEFYSDMQESLIKQFTNEN